MSAVFLAWLLRVGTVRGFARVGGRDTFEFEGRVLADTNRDRRAAVGYRGSFAEWLARVTPPDLA